MDRSDFAGFFKAVNGGHKPFKWQERLLDTVLDKERWPDLISAPTGAGKTSAIDVHVFATALSAAIGGPRLPRRLTLVVGRRVLVDDQYARAVNLADQLASSLHGIVPPERAIVSEVAKILASLRGEDAAAGTDESPLVTGRLRGGSVPSRAWRDYPAACAVLCATPDMWGSRLLFRGYGTSSLASPREAGLLAFDSVVLVDEAHLARQLLETARRVSHLTQIAERPFTTVPPLQVVEVSATPGRPAAADRVTAAGPVTVAVDAADLREERLAARLIRPKPVTLLPVADWPASGRQAWKVASVMANAVTAMRAEIGSSGELSSTICCYVNTVPMALAVANGLRRDGLRVVTVCGQVRPADLDRLRRTYPGLLSITGNADVDVLVSTQSLEVGADLDEAGIVTELASGSALAQRAGRGNRLGKRAKAPVTVIIPPGRLPETDQTRSGPYSAAELNEALGWITGRAGHPLGLAPWAVRETPPPPAHPRRRLYQRPELGDAWYWARTSDNLAVEPELDLWLSDSFEDESSVGIVVRDAVPAYEPDALQFVRDLPPVPRETFPVPYRQARAVLGELLKDGQTMVKVRGEEISALSARPGGSAQGRQGEVMADVRPGDVVVIDSTAEIFTRADGTFSPPIVAAPSAPDPVADMAAPARGRADDVLHYQPDPVPGSVILRLEWSPGHNRIAGFTRETSRRILEALTEDFGEQPERILRDSLADLLAGLREGECPADFRPVVTAAISLLRGKIKDCHVILRPGDENGARVAVLDSRRVVAEEDLQQVFTPRYTPVWLCDHQCDVADRAAALASELGLPDELTGALRLAGAHHDDGKADHRFQKFRLANSDPRELLAKSPPEKTRSQVQRQEANPGMPTGWRHEQRSVVDSWAAVQAATGIDTELAIRLIGTSHGHGRSWFPHDAAGLADDTDPGEWRELAAELFDSGGWDELIEVTHLRYGVWGCAYLEAVLRAADCQVSREGK